MQLPVPCLDCSNEQHFLHYHLHVASKHLEFRILAFLFLKGRNSFIFVCPFFFSKIPAFRKIKYYGYLAAILDDIIGPPAKLYPF